LELENELRGVEDMNVAFKLFGRIWFVGCEDARKLQSRVVNMMGGCSSKDKCDSGDCEKEEGEDEKQLVYKMGNMNYEYR
jgi:hypothetical protein